MGETSIEWAGHVWNPVVGRSVTSPGCTNCYAMKMAARLDRMGQDRYAGLTKPSKAGPVWTGQMRLVEEALTIPLRRRKPTTYFVNSMSDLFHEGVPDAWIDRLFAVMALCPQHTFQVLTKRSARMRAYMATPDRKRIIAESVMDISMMRMRETGSHEHGVKLDHFSACFAVTGPFPNVWLGVSAEDQQRADQRIPDLLATPAAVRFVSAEPLLGSIDFTRISLADVLDPFDALRGSTWRGLPRTGERFFAACGKPRLDWIVAGGESGPNARPMSPQWVRDIRDQCASAGTAFFFKQHGEWIGVPDLRRLPGGSGPGFGAFDHCRHDMDADAVRVGKRAAGRLLDGVEHNGMPQAIRAVGGRQAEAAHA